MPCIAIIDDRKDLRETIKRTIELALIEGWQCIGIEPFENLEEYISWITENAIAGILLDERLQEQVETQHKNITYYGHDFVDYIRGRFTTLPIYVITSWPEDDPLLLRFKDVEAIIERSDFCDKYDKYVPRIIRSAQKFLETYENELSELSLIASKIATGIAIKEEIDKAEAIKAKVGFVFPSDIFIERSELLTNCEKVLQRIEDLMKRLEEDSGSKE